MGYLMAAYAITVGGVVGYAAWLERERRRLLALAAAGRQNAVDKKASREV